MYSLLTADNIRSIKLICKFSYPNHLKREMARLRNYHCECICTITVHYRVAVSELIGSIITIGLSLGGGAARCSFCLYPTEVQVHVNPTAGADISHKRNKAVLNLA